MCYIWWAHVKVLQSNQEFFFFFGENTKYFNRHTHEKREESLKETVNTVYPKGPKSNQELICKQSVYLGVKNCVTLLLLIYLYVT